MAFKDIQRNDIAQSGHKPDRESLLRAAGAMGTATFLSRILGLVREQVFAFLFGAGNATDAFNIAFRIPNLLRDLFAEGAMSAALVPTFTQVRAKEGDRRAWRVAGLVFRSLAIIVGSLALLGFFFAPELVALYAAPYKHIPGKFELTILMTRIIFPFFPLVALAAAFMGILNACGKFFLPAFSSALFNLTSIVTGVVLYFVMPHLGQHPIVGMAVGVVLGGTVQMLCQLPSLYRVGYRWQPRLNLEFPTWNRDPMLRQMLFMMIPGTLGLAATQVNILVNSILATSQSPGAVSWLNYAFRLMQFPIGIFGVSLASATLPRVSRLWVDRDRDGVRDALQESLRHVFAVNLPASMGLAFMGVPIIQLLFEYGHFTHSDTYATARALIAYSLGLTAYSAVKVLVPVCYALGNTRIAVISSVLSVAFTITLNLMMIGPFGYAGLALGTSLAAILNAFFLLGAVRVILAREGGCFPFMPLLRSLGAHLGTALVMGMGCYLSYEFLDSHVPEALVHKFGAMGKVGIPILRALKVAVVVFEGIMISILLAKIFKLRETNVAIDLFLKKLKKKLRPGAN